MFASISSYELGKFCARIGLFLIPVIAIFILGINKKKRFPIVGLFLIGWILYVLPMELRPYFKNNQNILFWLGIIPSFGCAFALPVIIGLRDQSLTFYQAKRKLVISSAITFAILLIYELQELIPGMGTFDWLDIGMSLIGILLLNVIFIVFKSKFEKVFGLGSSVEKSA